VGNLTQRRGGGEAQRRNKEEGGRNKEEGGRKKEEGETVDGLCGVRELAPAFQSGGKPPHSKRWL
jgi:hypothetical protein